MRLRIEHRTLYRYERPVGFGPHSVRLFPRPEPGRIVHRADLVTNAGAAIRHRRDLFDNLVARCNYAPEPTAELRFDFTAEVELTERNPFDFLLENYAASFPFDYEPEDRHRLAAYLAPPEPNARLAGPLPFWKPPAPGGPTVTMLVDLTRAFREHLRYERRDTGRARPPAETLAGGIGACRDFAVLQAAVLHGLGLGARLVSGYLFEADVATSERRAAGAMHAWVEVCLPGAGWLGLDPTNGIFCDERHLATAVGLTPTDITPIGGAYYGKEKVASEMTASVELFPLSPDNPAVATAAAVTAAA